MPTKKFCGGSVKSLEDFYENSTAPDSNALRENFAGMLEDIEQIKHDPKLFAFALKTKVGDCKLHGAIFALRFIADLLEAKEKAGLIKHRVQFSFSVAENNKKGVVSLL
jgi:hypothetical protein